MPLASDMPQIYCRLCWSSASKRGLQLVQDDDDGVPVSSEGKSDVQRLGRVAPSWRREGVDATSARVVSYL